MLGIIKSLKLTFCMALHLSVYTSKTQLSPATLRLINIFTMSLLLLLTHYPSSWLFPSLSTVRPILLLGDIKRGLFWFFFSIFLPLHASPHHIKERNFFAKYIDPSIRCGDSGAIILWNSDQFQREVAFYTTPFRESFSGLPRQCELLAHWQHHPLHTALFYNMLPSKELWYIT